MINVAHAMGQNSVNSDAPVGGGLSAFVPLILMFAIFYFLLIRPQQKKAKEHQNMINNLKKGDRIITSGGVHGTITSLGDTTVSLEIAENVKIKINRGNVAALNQKSPTPAPQKHKDKAQDSDKTKSKTQELTKSKNRYPDTDKVKSNTQETEKPIDNSQDKDKDISKDDTEQLNRVEDKKLEIDKE